MNREVLLKQGYTHIAKRQTILADMLTPVALYDRLASAGGGYLFESVEGGERWGRYSMVGLPCDEQISAKDGVLTHRKNGVVVEKAQCNPLTWLQDFQARRKVANLPEDLPFSGGLVGYFAYDIIGYIEPRLAQRPSKDVLNVPDMQFMVSDALAVLDNLRGEVHLIVIEALDNVEAFAQAQARLEAIAKQLSQPKSLDFLRLQAPDRQRLKPSYELGEQGYKQAVATIKEYILAGDVMQVVPSQRMSVPFTAPALDLYRALRLTNPSPYMYLLDLGEAQIIGSSPEILARVQEQTVTVRPIAGTRKRGQTPAEDLALEQELLADEKELAEHTMLIDLGRNDIGRICQTGTVKITEKMAIERYSHVMHIVSNVEGRLRDGLDAIDVLTATFPAGTLSGASKVRAMEIIDELEPSRRGVYGGAVGYWSWSGNMDMAIAIRTGVIKDNTLYIQAGGGIVYDSNPEDEWQETLNKLGALLSAASMLVD